MIEQQIKQTSELEIFLIKALHQIVDLHDDGNGAVCECSQCKLARQSIAAAEHLLHADGAD